MVREPEETKSSPLPPAPNLSEETVAKVAGAVHGGLLNQARHLGPANIDNYFGLAESLYPSQGPAQEEEWDALKEKMRKVVSTAPKLRVICLTGTVTSYQKRENLVLVAFIRQSGENGIPLEAKVLEVNKEEITLKLDSSLPVATFSHGHLVLELRKNSTNKTLVASAELSLSELPEDMTERTVELQAPPSEGMSKRLSEGITKLPSEGMSKRLSIFFSDGGDNLTLMLGREETGVDCSTEVPRVLQNNLASKVQQILQVSLPAEELPGLTFTVDVEHVPNDGESEYTHYQQLFSYSSEGLQIEVESSKSSEKENSLSRLPIQCLLTDQLLIGAERRRRKSLYTSQSTVSSELPPVMRRLQSERNPSLVESLADMTGIFSPAAKKTELHMVIGMDRLITTLANHSEEVLEVEGRPGEQWRAKLCAQGNLLSLEELRLAIVRGLVLAADEKSRPEDLQTVFTILKGVADGNREEVDGAVAEAYLEAHALRPQERNLGHEAMNPYVQTLAGRGLAQSPTLGKYIDECLDVVERHRHVTFDALKEVIANLSLMVTEDNEDLQKGLQASVEKSAQALFSTWESEAKREIENRGNATLAEHEIFKNFEKQKSQTDSPNFEICRDVVNKYIYSEVHSPKTYQNLFSSVLPNYSTILCNKLVSCAIEMLPRRKVPQQLDPAGLGFSFSELHIASKDTHKLQMVYDCFVALKRVWISLHPGEKLPASVYETFSAYPLRWHDLAIKKAELEVE